MNQCQTKTEVYEGLQQNIYLTEEQQKEIILLFPNYIDTNPNLITMPYDQMKGATNQSNSKFNLFQIKILTSSKTKRTR